MPDKEEMIHIFILRTLKLNGNLFLLMDRMQIQNLNFIPSDAPVKRGAQIITFF